MKHLPFGKPLLILASLVVLVGSVACAQPAPSPKPAPAPAPKTGAAPVAGQTRQQAIQELYDAAKKEGEVLWQTPLQVAAIQPLVDGFQKKYPGVKLSAFYVNAPEMVTRIITESAAGKLTVDVGTGKTTYLSELISRDYLFGPGYDWRKVSDIDPASVIYDGRLTVFWDAVGVYIYNTKMVSAAEAPKTFEGLLDPKWKGRKIITTQIGQSALFLIRQWQKDKQAVLQILDRFAKQEPLISTSAVETVQRVASGEVPLGWTIAAQVPANLAKGAPIAMTSIGPSFDAPTGLYMPKNSPHPNAAKLFISWLATEEANTYWAQTSLSRWNQRAVGKLLKEAGVEYFNLNTAQDVKDGNELMAAAAKTLTGLGK